MRRFQFHETGSSSHASRAGACPGRPADSCQVCLEACMLSVFSANRDKESRGWTPQEDSQEVQQQQQQQQARRMSRAPSRQLPGLSWGLRRACADGVCELALCGLALLDDVQMLDADSLPVHSGTLEA